jgi:cytochrome c-type biogenesis protein
MNGLALGASLAASFGAGLLSFLSPCVLPLVPAWLSYLSGYGLADLQGGRGRALTFARSLAFSLGFSVVFVTLGLLAAGSSLLMGGATGVLKLVSGLLVILFGLNLVFDFLKLLNLEARFHARRPAAKGLAGMAGAFLVGLAFAAGWSPCIGPILASILLLAAREAGLGRAGLLLSAYSLGLALPFLVSGLAFDRIKPLLERAKRSGRSIQVAAGVFLVILGCLMSLGKLGTVSGIAARAGMALEASAADRPLLVRAIDLAAWAALAFLVALPPLLRPRPDVKAGGKGQEGAQRPAFSRARIILLCLIVLATLGEALGLWSAASIVAGWLSFQGA